MLNIKQLFKRKNTNQKVSKMLLDIASEYIALGEDIEEKQELLNGAVSAWNIACLDKKDRKQAIKKYMANFRKLNSTHSKQDIRDAKEDLMILIEQKDKLYPDERIQIINAVIREVDGKNHVTVASMNIE